MPIVTITPARVFISPLARRLAGQAGIAYADIRGSGPRGRIVRKDIEEAVAAAPQAAPARTGNDVRAFFKPGSYKEIPADEMRRFIVRTVTEAQAVPQFHLTADCELDRLLDLRQRLNDGAERKNDKPNYKLTVGDFIVKATALALQRVPSCNVVWAGDSVLQFGHSDVGVSIAVEGGLFIPVIREAESKSLTAISAEIKELAERAGKHRLSPEECKGGSVAVSNLGMYGVSSFLPIVNPPQAVILGVGAVEERMVPKNGQPAVVRAFTVTVSCDHRAVDGAVAAQFLAAFRALVENPMGVLV